MTKVVLNCDLECGGILVKAGETMEVDDDNLASLLRRNVASVAIKASPKKKKKAEESSDK